MAAARWSHSLQKRMQCQFSRWGGVRTIGLTTAFCLMTACSPPYDLPTNLITDPAQMARSLESNHSGQSFSATARVDYYADGKARKGKLFVLAKLPNLLRIEALTFTDDMLSLLVVLKDRFAYFERGKPECFTGPLCAAPLVARFPGANNPEMLLPLLLGRIPLLPDPDQRVLSFDRTKGVYLLRLLKHEIAQEVDVEPAGMIPKELRLFRDGLLELQVSYSGKLETQQGHVPKSCRLLAPREKLDLSIEYRQFDWEQDVESQAFEFQCPEGASLIPLECGGVR